MLFCCIYSALQFLKLFLLTCPSDSSILSQHFFFTREFKNITYSCVGREIFLNKDQEVDHFVRYYWPPPAKKANDNIIPKTGTYAYYSCLQYTKTFRFLVKEFMVVVRSMGSVWIQSLSMPLTSCVANQLNLVSCSVKCGQ